MKKAVVVFLVAVLILPAAWAMKVGLFVESSGQLEHYCIKVDSGASAKNVIDASGLDTEYSYGGTFLDSIDGLANDYTNSKSWWIYYDTGNGMKESQVGISDLHFNNNLSIVYFGYYGYDASFSPTSSPQDVDFFTACPAELTELEFRNDYVETGGIVYTSLNKTVIPVEEGQIVGLAIRLKNQAEEDLSQNDTFDADGTASLSIDDMIETEDFSVYPGDTETVQINFSFPFSTPGYYRGNLAIDASNGYERYSFADKLTFYVRGASSIPTTTLTTTETTSTTAAQSTIATSTTTAPAAPTGNVVLEPKKESSPLLYVIIGLGIAVIVVLALILFLILK